jgi:putative peptide zinc metalloprotease protein
MSSALPTFSESWHRVATRQLRLRRGVKVHRQMFRGERWYVIEDDLAGKYFRIRPQAWEFIARLDAGLRVEEAWTQCLDLFPETAPGQQECVNLLGQLYQANLLHYDAGDAGELFRRKQKREQRELRSRLLSIMFLRIPLVDPDRFIVRILPWVGWLVSPIGLLLWLVVLGLGLKTVFENWPALLAQGKAVLAPENLALFYMALILSKLLHEMGHAVFCRKFGGEVHTLGVMLLVFTPVPYVDVTSSWSLRSRRQRVLVGAAGMIVELFLASLCAMLWARSDSGGTVNAICYNIMFITSVSTLIFNLNPLLRFDGYYILTDLIGMPNLAQRSTMHLKHLWKRWVWGLRKSRSPAENPHEKAWMTGFGITSGVYRIFVFGAVLLFVADQFLILGLIMVVACIVGWIIAPAIRLIRYLSAHAELDKNRRRAVYTTIGIAAIVIGFLQFFPWPRHIEAKGIVESTHYTALITEAGGYVTGVKGSPGGAVKAGDVLITMENPELVSRLTQARALQEELHERLRYARFKEPSAIQPLEKRIIANQENLDELEREAASLQVTAKQDGIWSFLHASSLAGMWIPRGTPLGLILEPSGFEFTGVVRQADAGTVFHEKLTEIGVRIRGQAAMTIDVPSMEPPIPGGVNILPSASLGAKGGGDIPVMANDSTGRKASEPFYLVKVPLASPGDVKLLHGQGGVLRFRAGTEPLLPGWIRKLRQLLQKRYQM